MSPYFVAHKYILFTIESFKVPYKMRIGSRKYRKSVYSESSANQASTLLIIVNKDDTVECNGMSYSAFI